MEGHVSLSELVEQQPFMHYLEEHVYIFLYFFVLYVTKKKFQTDSATINIAFV